MINQAGAAPSWNIVSFFLLAFLIPLHAYAQNSVNFVIKSQSGEPLIGAVVIIEGTPTGSSTDAEGKTQLENIPDGEVEFEISYLGLYRTKHHP